MLSNRAGPFASCHSELSPKDYISVCFDLLVSSFLETCWPLVRVLNAALCCLFVSRDVCMMPATVPKVRTACVPLCLPMSMHVLPEV